MRGRRNFVPIIPPMPSPSRYLRQALGLLLSVSLSVQVWAKPADLAPFQAQAAASRLSLVLPVYPLTPDEVKAQADHAIKTADTALAALVAQDPAKLTFANTFQAYDAISGQSSNAFTIVNTVSESALSKEMRDTANEMNVKLQEWSVGLDYREDLYRTLKAFAATKPGLDREQQRLVDEVMRSYRRAGLDLPAAERKEVERLRKDLAGLETQFAININGARAPLDFTADELAGVPESFLNSPGVKQADGRYRVMTNITWHRDAILENARSETTRVKLNQARLSLATAKNIPVLAKLVVLRADIAHRLGYANWADYQTETRMAKTGATALKFEADLVAGLQPKFDAELKVLQGLKAAETGRADAVVGLADVPITRTA